MIVAVAGWRGVGSTTAALLLASAFAAQSAADEDAAWLVEADSAGGVLAGRMQLPAAALGGLEQLCFPPAGVGVDPAAVAARRGPLSVVLAPADPFRADACHRARQPLFESLACLDAPVVIDVGRVRVATPARPLLERVDAVLVVTSPEVSSAVSTVEWLQAAGRISSLDAVLDSVDLSVLMVDSPCGVAFPESTVRSELGDRLAAWLPWEPRTVDAVHLGMSIADRRLRRSRLAGAVVELARTMSHRYGDSTPQASRSASPTLRAMPAGEEIS
ncbi:MAG: hypothetical protein ACKOAZ_01750 [Ilumatobacteraceae bacterium]